MSLKAIFSELAAHLDSPEFLLTARHPDHPTALTRKRNLPLACLVAVMLCGMRMSIQAELDRFFANLHQQAQLVRHVSEQAFSQARAKLSLTAFSLLNDWVISRAQHYGFIPLWHGLRLVATDASTVRFGLRASQGKGAALADQILFALFLPGADLMFAAALYRLQDNNERQMLFEHLGRLHSTDLLLLDRGYPCGWLVSVLNQRGIPFCMRVEKSGNAGFACVRDFLRSGLAERVVTLRAPNKRDAKDYGCTRVPQMVRLVRHVAPNGAVRVLMTNLMDVQRFAASCFGRRLITLLQLIAKETYRHKEGTSKPRNKKPKPHKHMTQKN